MEKANVIKTFFITLVAFLSDKLGMLWPMLILLGAVLIIDYITGILDAKKHKELSSRIGTWGIVKKLLYGVAVAVGMIVDWTILNVAETVGINIPITTFFGLLVAIWLIINELISILENLTSLEVPLPGFLLKVVSNFKVVVEHNGDALADKINKTE